MTAPEFAKQPALTEPVRAEVPMTVTRLGDVISIDVYASVVVPVDAPWFVYRWANTHHAKSYSGKIQRKYPGHCGRREASFTQVAKDSRMSETTV